MSLWLLLWTTAIVAARLPATGAVRATAPPSVLTTTAAPSANCTCLFTTGTTIWIGAGIIVFVVLLIVAFFVGMHVAQSTLAVVRYPTVQTTSHAPASATVALHPHTPPPVTRSHAKKAQQHVVVATTHHNEDEDDDDESPFDRFALNKVR